MEIPAWTSVSTPYVKAREPGQRDPWSEEAAERGAVGTHQLRGVTEVPAPPDVAAALALSPGAVVILRQRVVLLDDSPVELADSYYPLAIAQGTQLAEHRKIRGGAVTLLSEMGHRIVDIEEDITSRPPTEDERRQLHLPESDWVLVLSRLSRDAAGDPVEFMRMIMVARGRHLRYQLRA